jgi:hypothetical protein
MVKALARAFRWCKLFETGLYGTAKEIAAGEKVGAFFMSPAVHPPLQALDIVEAILDG